MTRQELEHIIRSCSDITNEYEFIIVGSQSILGQYPNPHEVFTMSTEVDIYPMHAPELADKIEGSIGELSSFHDTYGYYAQGVSPETATLPSSWSTRVIRVQSESTGNGVGYCLDVIDLFLAKAVAGREKDRKFCISLIEHGYVNIESALDLVAEMPLENREKTSLKATIRRWGATSM